MQADGVRQPYGSKLTAISMSVETKSKEKMNKTMYIIRDDIRKSRLVILFEVLKRKKKSRVSIDIHAKFIKDIETTMKKDKQ